MDSISDIIVLDNMTLDEPVSEPDDVGTVANNGAVSVKVAKYTDAEGSWAHVQVKPPLAAIQEKVHLVFVVDVSGSMGSSVESVGADGAKENHGFSILDLVKHSLLTIVKSLDRDHKVTLVSYTDVARVELDAHQM